MRKTTVCACAVSLLVALVAAGLAQDQASPKALHVGFEKTKPVNDLDKYGSKPVYDIGAFASRKSVQDLSMLSRVAPKAVFNASQRLGRVANFAYNTGISKPLYNINAYSRVKPMYEVPSTLSNKPVYNIESYPRIKAVNSIP